MKPICLTLAFVAVLSLSGCAELVGSSNSEHRHLAYAGNDEYYPEPGYKWDHPGSGDLLVHWTPGIFYWDRGSNTYPHIVSSKNQGRWYPEAGYEWSQSYDAHDLHVRWNPGSPYADDDGVKYPHIIASDTEGEWFPAPGYTWAHVSASGDPIAGDLAVKWKPGSSYRYLGQIKYPHIVASDTEGRWWPEPGYCWAHLDSNNKPTDLIVSWTPGIFYRSRGQATHPHIIASTNEGSWYPQPGYKWNHLDGDGSAIPGDLDVHWVAGIKYWYMNRVKYENVVTSATEGEWLPAEGFAWANDKPGDLTVVAAAQPAAEVTRTTVAEGLPASTPLAADLGDSGGHASSDKLRK